MITMSVWQRVGLIFNNLISRGYFPGVGYDSMGWEAWVFFDEPVEGELGEHIKGEGDSILEALINLVREIENENSNDDK